MKNVIVLIFLKHDNQTIQYTDLTVYILNKDLKLEMCPSEHVWLASQHPSERDASIMKNNNVRSFFSESTTFLYYRPHKN